MLSYCVAWIAQHVPSPAPTLSATPFPVAFPTPSPFPDSQNTWTKAIYVLALAADAPTSAQISLVLASYLRPYAKPSTYDIYATKQPVSYAVIAEPTWTLAQYQQQCLNDPSTAGAIVALPPATANSSYNILYTASWTNLRLQTMVIDCEPTNIAYRNNIALVKWISGVRDATGRRVSFSVSTLLAILSGYLALHPVRTTTYTVATPKPKHQDKGAAYESSYTVGINSSFLAAAGVAALSPLATTNIGAAAANDAQLAKAMYRLGARFTSDLVSPCTDSGAPQGVPTISPLSDEPPPSVAGKMPVQCQWFTNYRFDVNFQKANY
jgi:hypothetical protein